MRALYLLLAVLIISNNYIFSQQPSSFQHQQPYVSNQVLRSNSILSTETCDNNIDDDGDGLIDCEDYKCYFKAIGNTCNCIPSNTIWIAVGGGQLCWVNLQTKKEQLIGLLPFSATDIAWTPTGKLYALDGLGTRIYEVDPASAQISQVVSLPSNYSFSNAMTSDKNGNLIIAAMVGMAGGWQVIKLNPSSGQASVIADLRSSGLTSGGDLAFSAGYLYLSCGNNIIAKINPLTGDYTSSSIKGLLPGTQIFGIVSSADGSLYLSDFNRLHKLNPQSMEASLAFTSSLFTNQVWGMANYNDNCNSVECKADVKIEVKGNEPYCKGQSIGLNAIGSGINGTSKYKWTLPDRSQQTGSSVSANQSGWYKVLYYSETDFCDKEDSVNIFFIDHPLVDLGIDTIICAGSQFEKESKFTAGISRFLWQDGSTTSQVTITKGGLYWLEVTNNCGSNRDSIIVTDINPPLVNLGPDLSICPYNIELLSNSLHDNGYQYIWNTGAQAPQIEAEAAGWYWLKATNQCGTAIDSVLISSKTAQCECSFYIPSAFTPNNDGKNEVFKGTSTCSVSGELTIYNRWGGVVFRTTDLSKGWDGFYYGQLQPNGVYIYSVRYRFLRHPKEEFRKGIITLIK